MSLVRTPQPEEIAAQGVLLVLILRGLWALFDVQFRQTARRNAVATGGIAMAFVWHRTTLADYGGRSYTEGVERLYFAFSHSWAPDPATPDHRLVALWALVLPAMLIFSAAWTATRPKDALMPQDHLARASLRERPR